MQLLSNTRRRFFQLTRSNKQPPRPGRFGIFRTHCVVYHVAREVTEYTTLTELSLQVNADSLPFEEPVQDAPSGRSPALPRRSWGHGYRQPCCDQLFYFRLIAASSNPQIRLAYNRHKGHLRIPSCALRRATYFLSLLVSDAIQAQPTCSGSASFSHITT